MSFKERSVYLFESLRAGADEGSDEVQTLLRTDCLPF
jgi:hypothetical protein